MCGTDPDLDLTIFSPLQNPGAETTALFSSTSIPAFFQMPSIVVNGSLTDWTASSRLTVSGLWFSVLNRPVVMSCSVFVDEEPGNDWQDSVTEMVDKRLGDCFDVSGQVLLMDVDADMVCFPLTEHVLNLRRCC